MCMLEVRQTKKCPSFVAYKILMYNEHDKDWETPIQRYSATNRLSAKGKLLTFDKAGNIVKYDILDSNSKLIIYSGAIHCYRTLKYAKESWILNSNPWDKNSNMCDIFKVVGKEYIGHNDREIAFKSVEFVDNLDEWEII